MTLASVFLQRCFHWVFLMLTLVSSPGLDLFDWLALLFLLLLTLVSRLLLTLVSSFGPDSPTRSRR